MKIIGSINGKNNRKLLRINKKREKKKKQLLEEEKIKYEQVQQRKKEEIIVSAINQNVDCVVKNNPIEDKNILIVTDFENKNNKVIKTIKPISSDSKDNNKITGKDKIEKIETSNNSKINLNKNIVDSTYSENTLQKNNLDSINNYKASNNDIDITKSNSNNMDNYESTKTNTSDDNVDISEYLKIEIVHILEQNIDDNIYELKKIDLSFYNIDKEVEKISDNDDIKNIEDEINKLLEKLEQIRKELISLEKTFELRLPIEEKDNYLIYLIDEYKDKIKNKKKLTDNLKYNETYKSIIKKIIDIEEKKEELLEKVDSKKEQLNLKNDKLKDMNESIVSITQAAVKIKNLVDKQNEMLSNIKKLVDENVHITEKVKYITKSVNHSFMDLFLLIGMFKKSLNIKNNAIAMVQTAVILDLINKMCTPTLEKVVIKENDLVDYEKMIKTCLNDTTKLDNLIDNNLDTISSIRYSFLYDYKECNDLSEYKEVMKNLDKIEEDVKMRKEKIKLMKLEIESELEENSIKVKKYSESVNKSV